MIDLLSAIASNVWAVFLVVLLFGGSIFVHELGHFLAARRRGAKVERFSIGFGPPIWSRRAKDGVEYRVSWFPLGGYVLLPQLADLGAIEGASETDVAKLPPVSYATKMIVFGAGAFFNILFALGLACIVWFVGQPTEGDSTTVAEVVPTVKNADGKDVPSPAVKAGLRVGDVILEVDGEEVETFSEVRERIALSSGWSKDGERQIVFKVRRGNEVLELPINPVISGREKLRVVGFVAEQKLIVGAIHAGSAVQRAGLQIEDVIVSVNDTAVRTGGQLVTALKAAPKTFRLGVKRGDQALALTVERTPDAKDNVDVGILAFKSGIIFTYPDPLEQVGNAVRMTVRNLGAVLNRRSDVNVSHFTGPIGIISSFFDVARAGIPFALWFTIIVNVNLAIFNLLPLPILDGGQMLFATIARLRGRPLPLNFIMAAQSVFLVLLLSMILYVSFFDVRRRLDWRSEPAPAAAPAK